MSQIAGKSISMQIQPADVDFLSTNGYVSVMPKEEYDRAFAGVSKLAQMIGELQNEIGEERSAEATLEEEERKTHSILFHFEGREQREAELARVECARSAVSKEKADAVEKDSRIKELIQKKSMIDRMVPYDGEYFSLTGLGVITLNDLNVRNYRVSDREFADFIEESQETSGELRSIAEKGSYHVSNLKTGFPIQDLSHLWSVAIGLGKLQGDPNHIGERFLLALGVLQHFGSTVENKMAAAEIMTSVRPLSSQWSTDDSDIQNISKSLSDLDHEISHHEKVPKELSAAVAAMMMYGRRFDGTYPTDKFVEFSRVTASYDSAAILSMANVPLDLLSAKFQSLRSLFNGWGYQTSEDSELASAYLAISDLGPSEVHAKMAIIIDALKNYLAYPLVAAAILTSISTLEANETLDLMEKAFSILASYAGGLERSELVSLSVRMIHGIRNGLVRELDPTAKIANTPVQFTHAPSYVFFPYRAPLIIAHHSYFSTYSGIGGYHPAHVHGFGGFGG